MFIDSIQVLYYLYMINPHKKIFDSAEKIIPAGIWFVYQLDIVGKAMESFHFVWQNQKRKASKLLYDRLIKLNHIEIRHDEEKVLFNSLTDDIIFLTPVREYLSSKQFLVEGY